MGCLDHSSRNVTHCMIHGTHPILSLSILDGRVAVHIRQVRDERLVLKSVALLRLMRGHHRLGGYMLSIHLLLIYCTSLSTTLSPPSFRIARDMTAANDRVECTDPISPLFEAF